MPALSCGFTLPDLVKSQSYFLADLPPEASLTPQIITEACQTLVRNRERFLLSRDTQSIIRSIAALAARWLEPEDPFRQQALEHGPAATGFSRQTIETGLNDFFSQVTLPNLQNWVLQDFGHARRLDELSRSDDEQDTGRHSLAVGPPLLAHFCAGNLPNPAFMSIFSGLIVRSAQFVKCASGSAFFVRLLGHSLHLLDSKLAACLEIAEWKGGSHPLEAALFDGADCVTAAGNEESLLQIRKRVPPNKRFLGYGNRVSFAYITRESLAGAHAKTAAAQAALDIIAWDQTGCLSPHVLYVETGAESSPEEFAELLAQELEALEYSRPRGAVSVEESAAIAIRRSVYEIRAANSFETRMWRSENSTAWTVILEAEPQFQLSCLNRFVYVKPSGGLEQTLHALEPVREQISTVGVAAPRHRLMEMAGRLARWGAPRVCALGKMQKPPLAWRHDGRPVLADLVTWCDVET